MRVYNKTMPIDTMPPAELITTPERYQAMIEHLSHQETIAIDTESNSLFAYQERVCLIQLSSPERDYLLDPFAFEALTALGQLLADAGIEKIMHAGDYDIATLKRDYGFSFNNIFDTLLAATALGEANLGLGALLEKFFGIHLLKKYQRANWGERPLKEEMLSYAQADSHFLIALRHFLVSKLEKTAWLELIREDSNAMARMIPAMKPHCPDVWRVKNARDLSAREMSLLENLFRHRECLAEKRDRPPFKIFGDNALVAIAQAMPASLASLEKLRVLSPQQLKRYGLGLVNVVNRWLEAPGLLHRPPVQRMREEVFERYEALMELRKNIAHQEDVASNLILSRDMVEKLAYHDFKTLAELQTLMADYPLRFVRYGEQIFALLQRRPL